MVQISALIAKQSPSTRKQRLTRIFIGEDRFVKGHCLAMIWYLHNKCPNFQTPGLKPKVISTLSPGLKAGAPTLRRNGTLSMQGINKYPSTEQGFQRTQEPAFLNASTNDASGIREMEEFDITNLAAPNADRWNPRSWTRALCAPVGAPGF